ncbi:MAG: hypothetical protein ACFB4I_19660 [Cyanophyceae cyanobacterium]
MLKSDRYSIDRQLVSVAVSAKDTVSLKSAFVVGLVLTSTNLGTGIGAGIAQLNIALTSCLSFFSSLLLVGSASVLGSFATALWTGRLELLSGILLISLGLYQFFD